MAWRGPSLLELLMAGMNAKYVPWLSQCMTKSMTIQDHELGHPYLTAFLSKVAIMLLTLTRAENPLIGAWIISRVLIEFMTWLYL